MGTKVLAEVGQKLCSKNNVVAQVVYNRNPRNLEMLRLMRKPSGYYFDKHLTDYWYRSSLIKKSNCIEAQLIHYTESVVVSASTNEWAIRKFLYTRSNLQAVLILAKVFAQRCMESGISSFVKDREYDKDSKGDWFYKVLEEEGITLEEPEFYDLSRKWFLKRGKRPWTVLE